MPRTSASKASKATPKRPASPKKRATGTVKGSKSAPTVERSDEEQRSDEENRPEGPVAPSGAVNTDQGTKAPTGDEGNKEGDEVIDAAGETANENDENENENDENENENDENENENDENENENENADADADGAVDRNSDDTPAGTALRLDAAARDALLGYGIISFFSTDYEIRFGTWNQRPVKKSEVRKLLLSMEDHGFRRYDHANFVSIVVKSDDLTGTLSQDAYGQEGLPMLRVKTIADGPLIVKAASGQHRFHAVKTKWDKLKSELDDLQSDSKKKYAKLSPEVKTQQIQKIGDAMNTLQLWGVTVYDEDKVCADNAEVAKHLSQNRILHDYMKTDEEGFAERLADLDMADEEKFDRAYGSLLKESRKKRLHKLARVMSNERMVKMFAAMLSLGKRFRSMYQFSTAHINAKFIGIHGGLITEHIIRAYNDLRSIATPTKFPMQSEVTSKLKAFNELTEDEITKGHELAVWVNEMREILRGDTTDADMSIWTETMIERLDFLFIDNIKNTAHMGLATSAGAGDISRYHEKLIQSLRSQWRQMTDLHQWALGKITFMLTIKQDEPNVAMPLLCPSLFTSLEKIYSQYPEALKEVSRWFEPLVDYHHEFTKTQDMLDHTSMIFIHLRSTQDLSGSVVPDIIDFFTTSRILYLPWLELRLTSDENDFPPRVVTKKEVELIWSRSAVDGVDPFKLSGTQERRATYDALVKWTGDYYNVVDPIPRNESIIGSILIERTLWKWKYEHTHKKRHRVHGPLSQVAIMEDIRQRYVWSKIDDEILVQFRKRMSDKIEDNLRPQNKKVSGKWKTIKGIWTWPVVFPGPDVPVREQDWNWANADDDKLVAKLRNKQVARFEEIRVKREIQRVIDAVQRCPAARFSLLKDHSGIIWQDVYDALSFLCMTLELNSDRLRFRDQTGDEAVFLYDENVTLRYVYNRATYLVDPNVDMESNQENKRQETVPGVAPTNAPTSTSNTTKVEVAGMVRDTRSFREDSGDDQDITMDDREARATRRSRLKDNADPKKPKSKGKAKDEPRTTHTDTAEHDSSHQVAEDMEDIQLTTTTADVSVPATSSGSGDRTAAPSSEEVVTQGIVPLLSQVSLASSGLPELTQSTDPSSPVLDDQIQLGSPFSSPMQRGPTEFPDIDIDFTDDSWRDIDPALTQSVDSGMSQHDQRSVLPALDKGKAKARTPRSTSEGTPPPTREQRAEEKKHLMSSPESPEEAPKKRRTQPGQEGRGNSKLVDHYPDA